jgi:nucleoside-diphosphate-sugar epimerase
MIASSSIVPPGGLVLVTGVTGFIGSYIANGLLELGYRVRGTVRSSEKATWVTQALTKRNPSADFEAVIVPDQNAPGVWDAVLKDVDGIAHVAGDVSFGPDPTKVITPSVEALRRLLEAARKEPSVKRFVFTSSDQAASNRSTTREIPINEETWNEEAIEAAWKPPPYEAERGWDVYSALKAQVEKEMWKFSQEEKPSFVVNSVLPTYTIGAIFDEQQAGSTAKWLLDFYNDPSKDGFMRGFGASYYVYVGDVALLHIGALTLEEVQNKRLLAFAGRFNFNSWLEVFRKQDPGKPWPEDDPTQALDTRRVNGETELDILRRFGKDGWTSFEDSVLKVLESP